MFSLTYTYTDIFLTLFLSITYQFIYVFYVKSYRWFLLPTNTKEKKKDERNETRGKEKGDQNKEEAKKKIKPNKKTAVGIIKRLHSKQSLRCSSK